MAEGEAHWAQEYQCDGIDSTNREAFVSAMKKYPTEQSGMGGGFNAMQKVGTPFRFPESMDKLPTDESRAEFRSQANSLLGRNIPKDVEGYKDVNFTDGLAEGKTADENFTGLVKAWAAENDVSTGDVEKMAKFYNGPLTEYAVKAAADKKEADKTTAAEACNTALIEKLGSEEKVKEFSVLMHRTIVDRMGLTPEESGEFVDAMAESILTTNPVMARGMLNLLSGASREGSSEKGEGIPGAEGVKQASPYEAKKARWPQTQSLWGEASDTWESQSLEAKKTLGYKDPSAQK